MGKYDPDLVGLDLRECNGVCPAAAGNFGLGDLLLRLKPAGASPCLHSHVLGWLNAAVVVVEVKHNAADFFFRAQVYLEPIGFVGRTVTGPAIDRVGAVNDLAVDRFGGNAPVDVMVRGGRFGKTFAGGVSREVA